MTNTSTTRHLMSRSTRTGFSLVEILIVTVCIAIAAMLVLPAAANTNSAKLAAAAKLLIADLQFAQLHAIGNSANRCIVVFDAAANQYHLALVSTPTIPITNPATNQPYLTTFGSTRAHYLQGVSFKTLDVGSDHQLGFTSLGALDQSANATITLQSGSATLTIHIDAPTGEPCLN